MTLRLVALGDSTSCGEGVGLAVPPALTWPARLPDVLLNAPRRRPRQGTAAAGAAS